MRRILRRVALWFLLKANHATVAAIEWFIPPPPDEPCPWCAWARHFGDGRNQWETIAKRPTEESAWTCVGRYVEQYPGTSAVVLPDGMRPEEGG